MTTSAHSEGRGEEAPEDANVLSRNLKHLVNKVVFDGVGPLTGSIDYAQARLGANHQAGGAGDESDGVSFQPGSAQAEKAIARIVKESVAAAGTAGFVTGLGGFVTMLVALPANIAGAVVINARMVGSIAYLRGYDLQDPHTQAMLMLSLVGSNAQKAAAATGLKIGTIASKKAVQAIPIALVRAINRKAGFMLLAKYGTKRSLITISRGVPVVGAGVGATIDASLTAIVGRVAKKAFPAH